MSTLPILVVSVVGYLVGAVSFAVIIGKARGVDVLSAGSGNPGATNVKRLLGRTAGNTVFALDFLKGSVATGWPLLFAQDLFAASGADASGLAILGAVSAIIGHSFSPFIGFRGGKGVAVTMGGLLILVPLSLLIGMLLWLIVFQTTRYVSLASIVFALSLPLTTALTGDNTSRITTFATAIAILIVYRHRSNLGRLLKGTEHKFEKSSTPDSKFSRNG